MKYNYAKEEMVRVIFLQDVPNVATAGEVKEVADGYGRNFLIPRKLALLANSQSISQLETRDKVNTQIKTELIELAHQLEGKEVSLKARVGAKDRIYGSITSADIASELNNTTGLVIDKRKIELDEPIRQLGSYEIGIRLAKDVIPKIRVTVTEEEPTKKEAKKTTKKKEKAPKKEAKKTTKKEEKAPKKEAKKTTKKEEKAPKKEAKKTTAKKEKRTQKKEEKT